MRCVRGWRVRGQRRAQSYRMMGPAIGALLAAALTGCVSDGGPAAVAQGPAGATIAFESIDGPPRPVFDKMVDSLKRAAARKQLAVVTREGAAAYRVRGYMAANVIKGRTHIDWVWDVYDVGRQRSLRITGDEATNRGLREAWAGADDATVGRIADTSIERLAAFVGGAPVAPNEPMTASGPVVAEAGTSPPAAQGDAPPTPRKPHTAQAPGRSLAALQPTEGR